MPLSLITKSVFCSLLILLSGSALSYAQESPATKRFGFQDNSVNKPFGLRLDPFEYRGVSKNIRGIDVNASLRTTIETTSNVRSQENGESDIITIFNPIINLQKKIGRHLFGIGTEGEIKQHFDNDNENVENINLFAGAELEATKSLKIPLFIGFSNLAIPRENIRVSNPAVVTETPVERQSFDASIGLDYKPNRFGVETTAHFRQVRFDNNRFLTGAPAIQEDRDHDLYSVKTDFTYDFTNSLQPRLSVIYEDQDFLRNSFINGGFTGDDRSNQAVTVLAGGRWNYKNLIIADIGLGATNFQYDDEDIEDTTDFSFQSEVIWQPSQKINLEFNAGRITVEDNLIIAALNRTNVGAALDYELKQNIFMRGFFDFMHEDFTETNRVDKTYNTGLGLQYILNPRIQLGAGYEYKQRNSPVKSSNFEDNRFRISLTGSL